MTQFSSRPPFNDDPMPWVHDCSDVYDNDGTCALQGDRNPSTEPGWVTEKFRPRPEFDRPQHNPTNPILTEFRGVAGRYYSFRRDLAWWLECLNDPSFDYSAEGYLWTPEQVDHARRALTRLANLTKEEA